MKNRTGRRDDGVVSAGVQTLSVRQSSSPTTASAASSCGHFGPKAAASRTPAQGSGGAGGRQRRSPTGGAANGIPLNANVSPDRTPRTSPLSVTARSPAARATRGLGVRPCAPDTPNATTPVTSSAPARTFPRDRLIRPSYAPRRSARDQGDIPCLGREGDRVPCPLSPVFYGTLTITETAPRKSPSR